MNRTTLSLIVGATALAAVTGLAALTAPKASGSGTAKTAARLPVEQTQLLCPEPSTSDVAETAYTSFTPVSDGTGSSGKASLTAATEQSADGTDSGASGTSGKGGKGGKNNKQSDVPSLNPQEPGTPVTTDTSGAGTPALTGTATGRFAPGWTVQETTDIAAGTGRGLLGTNCTAPDTEFWFPGASTASSRTDYLHLTNPDDSAAVVDIELYGKNGKLSSTLGDGLTVQPHSTEPVLLSTLTGAQ